MIDKKNSDEDFSDEGFDEEFSFDADEDHTEVSAPAKGGKPLISSSLKKVFINLVLGLSLIASIFGVYQYWANDSKQKALAKKTMSILPNPSSSSTSKPTAPAVKKENVGTFDESEVAALKREETKSATSVTNKTVTNITEKNTEAQKGVFVFKAPSTETVTVTKTEIKETKTAAAITPPAITPPAITAATIKPAEVAMTALQKAEAEQKILEQKAFVQQTLEQIQISEDQKLAAQKELEKKEALVTPKEPEQKMETVASIPSVILSPTPTTAAIISPIAQQPVAPTTALPGTPTSTDVQEMTKEINKTLEAVSKLNQQMEGNLNQVKYVDAYTREVSLNVEKLNAQVATMDNRIQALTNLANTLSKDLGKVRHEVGYAKRVAVAPEDNLDLLSPPKRCPIEEGDCGPVGPRRAGAKNCVGCPEDPEYVVHAVIPGRAWLKSCKGQILTVTEGETVGNYGKVLVIDAANSIVLTSSGIAFR